MYSEAESGRYGDGTGALQHQQYLMWKNVNNTWSYRGGTALDFNYDISSTSKFWFHDMNYRSFETCEDGRTCPWQ